MQPITRLKAQTLAAAFKMITGFEPAVTERLDGTALLIFREEDLPKIRATIETLALKQGKSKGDVSVALAPIMSPLAIKYLLPVIAGIFIAGGIGGYFLNKELER